MGRCRRTRAGRDGSEEALVVGRTTGALGPAAPPPGRPMEAPLPRAYLGRGRRRLPSS
jgi:hypothetical protein